jgi:hypothetical protein
MRRETSVDGIVKIFFRLASDCLKQFYIIVTLQKRPKIDTLNFDKLLLQFVVVVIKQAVIKSEIILRRLANIKFQQKRSTKVLLGGHIYLLWFKGIVLYSKKKTHNPYKKEVLNLITQNSLQTQKNKSTMKYIRQAYFHSKEKYSQTQHLHQTMKTTMRKKIV